MEWITLSSDLALNQFAMFDIIHEKHKPYIKKETKKELSKINKVGMKLIDSIQVDLDRLYPN